MNVERGKVEFHKNGKSVGELQGKVNEQTRIHKRRRIWWTWANFIRLMVSKPTFYNPSLQFFLSHLWAGQAPLWVKIMAHETGCKGAQEA